MSVVINIVNPNIAIAEGAAYSKIFLMLTVFLSSLAGLLTILGFVLWLTMVYKAWLGDEWEVPVLGALSKKVLKRFSK